MEVFVNYQEKTFVNVSSADAIKEDDQDKEALTKLNTEYKDMFSKMQTPLKDNVTEIVFTDKLSNHPVCLTTKGEVSLEMQKVMNAMPNGNDIKATTIMEINKDHKIATKLKELYEQKDYETLENYSKILYAEARLIEGLSIENPTEISNLVCNVLAN